MENPGILNKRRWSVMRKAQIIGAATGAVITIGMPITISAYDGGPFAYLLLWLEGLVFSLTASICSLLGWTWKIDTRGPLWIHTFLASVINAFLLFLVGTLIGWLINKFRKAPID